jgi:Uncharacterized protein conserved in archaea
MDIFAYSDAKLKLFIEETAQALENASASEEAVQILFSALQKYTVFDLQKIGGHVRREVDKLPEPYRRKYRPYSGDLLRRYHEFITAVKSGAAAGPIRDLELWKSYWKGACTACFSEAVSENDPRPELSGPAGKFFYRLVYGYTMLIADEPGHPVGMPFPGGWTIYEKGGEILCPIRDKEKDLPQALCNFCPAVQDPDCK